METKIRDAIGKLVSRITFDVKHDDALKFTQAALNLAHAAHILDDIEIRNRIGPNPYTTK